MKNKSIIIIISTILVLSVIGVSFWVIKRQEIDNKNITNQENKDKNININKYTEKLPSVEYNKIDYPVKETYTYKFNDYSITIDIPEGFEYFTIKKPRVVKPIKSTSIADSCETHEGICSGPSTGIWKDVTVQSDDSLCIMNSDVRAKLTDKKSCDSFSGLRIYPKISKYTGINISDILENTVDRYFNSKKVNDNVVFFVSDSSIDFFSQAVISNKQLITASAYSWENSKISRDLYFSILGSIKLKN